MQDMVPLLDLGAQAAALQCELERAVGAVLKSGRYVLGEPVEEFERDFAEFCGVQYAIAVNTGTSALHLALLAAGIGPGDEVITTPMTFVATVAAILYIGARPRLVDIDLATGNIDPEAVARAITPRTRAILPVHLHGRVADMGTISEIARRRGGITVIEDAAQAHGALQRGKRAGALAEVGCFSFYPGKNLGACGEGGALTTDHPEIARRARLLRDWGQERKYVCAMQGFNYRMDAIQGAVLGVKLQHLEKWTGARLARAARYDTLLASLDVRTPPPARDGAHVYHVYAIRVPNRDRIHQKMTEAGIQTSMHYPVPVHLQPAYVQLGCGPRTFPNAEAFAAETLSLPIYPELSETQLERVCTALKAAIRGAKIDGV
jgi:dTDP-4-amino-4,6-dideoxygalactose transaminase